MNLSRDSKARHSTHQQIMRGVIPILAIIFVLFALVGFALYQNNVRSDVERNHTTALGQLAEVIDTVLQRGVLDAGNLAGRDAILAFSRQAAAEDAASHGAAISQIEVVRAFLDTINDNPGSYLGLSYVNLNGSKWTQVTNSNNQISTDFALFKDALSGDQFFSSVLNSGQTIVTPIALRKNWTGSTEAIIRVLSPVFNSNDNALMGFVEITLNAAPIVEAVRARTDKANQRWLLVDNAGQLMLDTASSTGLELIGSQTVYPQLSDRVPEIGALIAAYPNTELLVEAVGNNVASIHSVNTENSVANADWHIILIDSASLSVGRLLAGFLVIGLLSALTCGVTVYLVNRTLRTRLAPLSSTRDLARKLVDGQTEIPQTIPGDDEFSQITNAFQQVSSRVSDLSSQLVRQTETHQHKLRRAARLSRELNAITEWDTLNKQAVERIGTSFGLRQAQLFVVDDVELNVVLVAGYGPDTQQPGLRIQIGSSDIGQAAASGETVIQADWLALPLKAGDSIIGVLHLQSTEVFTEDDISLFEMLADQLALALYTARQFSTYEQHLLQQQTVEGQHIQHEWEATEKRLALADTYHYDLMDVRRGDDQDSEIIGLSAPISIRGQVIGSITAAAAENVPFTEGDQLLLRAVADRVGLAIEGARLFQETQTSLSVTSTLYELSRRLNEASQINDIVRVVVTTIVADASAGQVWMIEAHPIGTTPGRMEMISAWSAENEIYLGDSSVKPTLSIPGSPLLKSLSDNRIKVIADVTRDRRLDEPLKGILQRQNAGAAAFIPFNARGEWRGVLVILFAQPRQFTEAEGRIFSALTEQVGVALDNRLLIQQTEMTLDQIERLYAASRIINTAQTPVQLLGAVLAATPGSQLEFELGLLEGPLDRGGWPTLVRIVAKSEKGEVLEANAVMPLNLAPDSPMRLREPQSVRRDAGYSTLFPLFSANQPIAILYLLNQPINQTWVEDYEIYRALSGQMSTVLENRRLLLQTSNALDETRRLYATSRAISAAQDLQQVYTVAAHYLTQSSVLVSRISIALAGPTPGYNAPYVDVVHVWTGTENGTSVNTGTRLNIAESALIRGLVQGKSDVLYFETLPVSQVVGDPLRINLTRWGAASALVARLRSPRDWFGVVICESPENQAFDEQYVRFVQAVADQIAIAVENRLLFEKAQAEAQRALTLAEAGQLATQLGSDFERNIAQVFARVASSANYDRWMLGLLDEEHPTRLVKVTMRSPMLIDDTQEFYYDLETASHSVIDAVKLQRMLLVNDPAHYPAFDSLAAGAYGDIGKHIVTPVYSYQRVVGALMVGRGLDQADLDEGDEQLVRTLAAQVAVAIENRRLYRAAEREREYLRSILETMPTGIVVLDARTLKPIQTNQQAEVLLGRPVNFSVPFSAADYNLIRTGTNAHYPEDELPITVAAASAAAVFGDDIAAISDDGGRTDLLLNAAPIFDGRGNLLAIVAAFQDISNLRGLENTLQNSLREQISLYEATRALSEANNVDDALDTTIGQIVVLEPMDGYVVLLDEHTGGLKPVRGLLSPEQFDLPPELFHAEALLISNLQESLVIEEGLKQTLSNAGILALATVPMRARDTLRGWIVVLYDRTLDFSTDNERFLLTLADNAALALDNRALQQQTEAAFQEATTLYETSRALANATTFDDLVTVAATYLGQQHVDQIFIAIPADTRPDSDLVVVSNWQRSPEMGINLTGVALNAEQFPAWPLLSSSTMITVDDALTDPQLDDMSRMGLASTETRALSVLPLRAGNRRLGVLWMASSRPFVHTAVEQRVYRSFAEQASLSMEAARLFEQTERRARQLAISAEISQVASSILDINELLPRAVDLIREAFGYDHAQVFLMDKEDRLAVLRASTGDAGRQLLAVNHHLEKGSRSVIGQVTATGKPVIALDTADARFVHKPNPFLPLTRSEMALPIVVKGRVVGALDVQSNTPDAFSDEDIKVLTTLAAQIAVALENARLFEQSESRAREMGFLFNATTAASASDRSLHDGLQSVAELVRNTLEALNVSIYLTESYTDQYEEMHTLLRAVALSGSDQPISELSEIYIGNQDNILSQVAGNLETRIIPNVEKERRYLPVSILAQSALAIPLATSNHIVGVLALEDRRPEAYTQETINLLRTLANSLSTIIQNSRLLEQVQSQNEQLRELDRLKSDFLANMSHELRTPLNSIIGFSRVILKGIDGPLTEMQEQDLSTIYNSGTHLLGLINDILDQAKINSGKMDLHPEYFDAKPVLEGVRSIGIGLIKDKSVDIKLEIVSGLPQAYGDEFRTRQVLLNLVSNAAKFTQKGTITIRGYVERQADGQDMLRVDVQDSGIGIAEKDIPLLFEAFRQVDSSLTRTVGGTGLGLPIAKSLIEMQGGQMLVHSVINQGSTFSILLPLTPPASENQNTEVAPPAEKSNNRSTIEMNRATVSMPATEDDPTFAPSPNPPTISNGQGESSDQAPPRDKRRTTQSMVVLPANRQILLIEDNPSMVDQLRRALQRESFDIFAASIPLEAEAMASGLHPTLIIMDADFAGGESWNILRRLQERDDTSDIPVIMLALNNLTERARQDGAFAFLQRPFVPEQLLELVRKAEQDSQTERILIIDDQPESSRLIQHILDKDSQYRVFVAHSGAQGIGMVARRRPDLVILDLRMPEKDGFAVLEELRANPETASIPVMIITSDTLNAREKDRLSGVNVIFKTDLSQQNYDGFIQSIKSHLSR